MCLPALRLLASGLGQNLFALSDLCLKEDEGAEEDMYIYIYIERERERERVRVCQVFTHNYCYRRFNKAIQN